MQTDKPMSTSEAGKLGGEKVKKERGPEFYSQIGKMQGKENNPGNFANRPKEDVKAAGRHGGQSRGSNAVTEDKVA
jgi:general stress protein YciG